MDIITSSENSLIKTIIKLKQRKYRYEYGKFVLEGYRLIKDFIDEANSDAVKIVTKESKYFQFCDKFENVIPVADRLFDKLTDTVSSQGIIAVAAMPEFKDKPTGRLCLYLDAVSDPGNLGTVIRTAAACGFCDIVLHNCVDVYNPKTIRSSMSTFKHCNFILSAGDMSQLDGYTVVCADMDGDNIVNAASALRDKKICLVIGSEATGVGDEMLRYCDVTVALPMDNGVESLNAAVSAGILMYYLRFFN